MLSIVQKSLPNRALWLDGRNRFEGNVFVDGKVKGRMQREVTVDLVEYMLPREVDL